MPTRAADPQPDDAPRAGNRNVRELSSVLDPADLAALERYLTTAGFLKDSEQVSSVSRAGEGNMNLVLRVRTSARSLIVKQGRPWVERYPSIAAPPERTLTEAHWYELASAEPSLAPRMPRLLGVDASARVLVLSDLGEHGDYLHLYAGGTLSVAELDSLIDWLARLHEVFADDPRAQVMENRAMRALNHEHIFQVPFRAENGLPLDEITPGLKALAGRLRTDGELLAAIGKLGERYLGAGATLLHGDYYPGSWLRASQPWIIDPEFGFYGPPEFDLGVMLAHMRLAAQPASLVERALTRYGRATPVDEPLVWGFAGVEVMRRLLGVSQLPVEYDLAAKQSLIAQARRALIRR